MAAIESISKPLPAVAISDGHDHRRVWESRIRARIAAIPKIGQLTLLYGKAPSDPRYRHLEVGFIPTTNTAFLLKLDIHDAVALMTSYGALRSLTRLEAHTMRCQWWGPDPGIIQRH